MPALALPVLAAVIASVALYLPLADKRDRLSALQHSLTRLNAEISAARPPIEQDRATRLQAIASTKAQRAPTVSVLADLSRTIPEHTWLRQVMITPGAVTIRGETRDTSDLVAQLETAARFRDAKFDAALTRDSRSDYQRFKLTVNVDDQ